MRLLTTTEVAKILNKVIKIINLTVVFYFDEGFWSVFGLTEP